MKYGIYNREPLLHPKEWPEATPKIEKDLATEQLHYHRPYVRTISVNLPVLPSVEASHHVPHRHNPTIILPT